MTREFESFSWVEHCSLPPSSMHLKKGVISGDKHPVRIAIGFVQPMAEGGSPQPRKHNPRKWLICFHLIVNARP